MLPPAGPRAAAAALACVLSVLLAGCGGDADAEQEGRVVGSRTLTVYSSLPLHGPARREGQDMVNAIKLALQDAEGHVGVFKVNYVSLDDADAESGRWDRDLVLDNARTALQDRNTIAYIGDADSGASALSLPVLNGARILQVSPSNTYLGLTREGTGNRDEPERFSPSGTRTFGRVVPADNIQAAAQVALLREEDVSTVALVHDGSLEGRGLVDQVRRVASDRGVDVVAEEEVPARADDYRDEARAVAATGADAVLFGGGDGGGAPRLFAALHDALPEALLLGGDDLAGSPFAGRLDRETERRVRLTSPALGPGARPEAARRFVADFRREFGRDPEPSAVFGYEAMGLVLAAIRAAGEKGNDREAVIDALFATRDRKSVLGTYSIDAMGDTTLAAYGGYRVRGGRLVFDTVLRAPSS